MITRIPQPRRAAILERMTFLNHVISRYQEDAQTVGIEWDEVLRLRWWLAELTDLAAELRAA